MKHSVDKSSSLTAQSSQLFSSYLDHIRPMVTTATLRQKAWQVRWFMDYMARRDKLLSRTTRADIDDLMKSMAHCAQSTIRDRIASIRDLWKFACRTRPGEFTTPDPTKDVAFLRKSRRKLPRVPNEVHIRELLTREPDPCDTHAVRNRAMVELAYGSGLRRAELAALNIEDIDHEKAEAYIRGKGGKTRIVPVSPTALRAIRGYLHQREVTAGPLFVTTKGKRLSVESVSWVFQHKIGLRAHLFRHACATHLVRHGCDIRLVQELLGHAHLTTTQRYTHLNQEDVTKMVKQLHPRAGN